MYDIDGFTVNGFVLLDHNFIEIICTEYTGGEILLNIAEQFVHKLGYDTCELQPLFNIMDFYIKVGYRFKASNPKGKDYYEEDMELYKRNISMIDRDTEKLIRKYQNKKIKNDTSTNEKLLSFKCNNVNLVNVIHNTILAREMYENHGLCKVSYINIGNNTIYYDINKYSVELLGKDIEYEDKIRLLEGMSRFISFLDEKELSFNESVITTYRQYIYRKSITDVNVFYFCLNHLIEKNKDSERIFRAILKDIYELFDSKEYNEDPMIKFILRFTNAYVKGLIPTKTFRKNFRKINIHLKGFIETKFYDSGGCIIS